MPTGDQIPLHSYFLSVKFPRANTLQSLQRWTTFLKARLNCSLPGDYPFYFNNIQSTSGWHREAGKRVFYAVFTTPDNAIPGSAICRFIVHFFPWPRLLKAVF